MATEWYVIAGLGNPGKAYENTRHNIGFMAIHRLSDRWGITGREEKRWKALIGTGRFKDIPVILMQPLTYMNLSGEAIQPVMAYYQVPPERLLVVYDDVALPFGAIRLRGSGSSGGQNGMKSIIQQLGGRQDFPRLRLGIGQLPEMPPQPMDLKDYVLSPFSELEREGLETILPKSAEAVETWLLQGCEKAMSRFNGTLWAPPKPEPAAEPSQDL